MGATGAFHPGVNLAARWLWWYLPATPAMGGWPHSPHLTEDALMKRPLVLGLVLILNLLVHSGPLAKQRDDHDALDHAPMTEASDAAARAGGEDETSGRIRHRDLRVDLPTFVWASRQARTPAAAAALSSRPPAEAARQHLRERASLYRLTDEEARTAVLDSVHDTGRGAIIVTFRRQAGGIGVFRDELRLAMDRGHELVAIAGYIGGSASEPGGHGSFRRDAEEAIAVALEDLTQAPFAANHLRREAGRPGGYDAYELTPVGRSTHGDLLAQPVRGKRVYFRLPDRLEAAYYVELDVVGPGEADSIVYSYVVSAEDDGILFRRNLTDDAAFSYRVWADPSGDRIPLDSPHGSAATPHPTALPDGTQVPFVAPILVTLQNGPISTNDPWLAPAATVTNGNNADGYADLFSPDGFAGSDLRADLTGPLSFDRTYNTSLTPNANTTQQKAAVAQLFYDVNFLHDWFYDSGFNEASRNAQTDNYGRGGVAGDNMRAEAQDFSGRNNANMSTPADGGRPRMQMFIFDANGPSALTVNAPGSIAGDYQVGVAAFGPTSFSTTGDVALVNDGAGTTSDGCETPFVNAGAISGRLALVDRGTCSFKSKVRNAQLNGAIGAIIANNTSGTLTMGNDPNVTATITIPSLMISQEDGATISAELGGVVNATLERELAVDHDGTIDNQIVAHEWGHYISNRLIGNSAGLTNSQGRGMGEGWGDFHAMLITVRPEDALAPAGADFAGAYAMVSYSVGGSQGHYFGIRRYPYSTDLAINPLTFRHIGNGFPLPPTAPVAGGSAGTSNAEVHNTGEIWASMLWDCYASLLRDTLGPSPRLTYAQAQQRMKDYLVAAYKLTPNAPTILEARNAVLAAALAGDPVDYDLFWRAFARRGAGRAAVAPERASAANQFAMESFVASDLVLDGFEMDDADMGCDADGTLDAGETADMVITLRNLGPLPLGATAATIASASAGVSFPSGGALLFPASTSGGTTTASVPVALGPGAGIRVLDFTLTYDNVDLEIPGPQDLTFSHRGNADDLAAQSAGDDVESASPAWGSLGWLRVAAGTTDHSWLGLASRSPSDGRLTSPPLQVAATGSFSFSFRHRFLFEFAPGPPITYFDGGMIEISTDNGATWNDVAGPPYFVNPGYSGGLAAGGGNPLEGRQAFSGNSPGYPAFNTVNVNLGTALQGQTVRIRFRIGTDEGTDNYGWEIDDIVFNNITNLPFHAVGADAGVCVDTDGDTFPDPSDCAPLDGSIWTIPDAVDDLTLTGTGLTTMTWSAPDSGGMATPLSYDLLRSEAAGSFAAAVCLESDEPDLAAADAAVPATIYYYLIRAQNSCGDTLGADSSGVPRTGIGCP